MLRFCWETAGMLFALPPQKFTGPIRCLNRAVVIKRERKYFPDPRLTFTHSSSNPLLLWSIHRTGASRLFAKFTSVSTITWPPFSSTELRWYMLLLFLSYEMERVGGLWTRSVLIECLNGGICTFTSTSYLFLEMQQTFSLSIHFPHHIYISRTAITL